MDIHQAYRIAYEAALAAQLISLQARLKATRAFSQTLVMFNEGILVTEQIFAVQAEIERLNQGD